VKSQLVFQEKTEMERLRVQNSLLSCYEVPVFVQIFSERQNIAVLDIGCNDGTKTVERFSLDEVSCVIGLEYNEELAQKAQKKYGNEKLSFYHVDVETEDFSKRLCEILKEKQIKNFDVIYLSFLLMHLTDVNKLLTALRPFLKTDGKLFVIEPNDSASTLNNDPNGLLGDFLRILDKDKYSGHREVGANICETLSACGYENIIVWHDAISAGYGEMEKKKAIFTTFFSYLPEDIRLLLDTEPENIKYKSWSEWLDRNYETLRNLILQEKSVISMGMKILTCTKGGA